MKGFAFSETFVIPDVVVKWLWRVGDPRLSMPHLHPWVPAFGDLCITKVIGRQSHMSIPGDEE